MREILFKAKRIDNGGWVEGLLTIMWRQYHIINPSNENIAYAIDETTICQYTGLTDKNGKRIWENDYISCKQYVGGNQIDYHIELGYVEMNYGAFGLHRKQGYYRPFKDWLEDYEYEVIGNIFDNPELLGGGTD